MKHTQRGTGKTRTAAAIMDVLANAQHITNVLFLADRKELVKQAKEGYHRTSDTETDLQ